MNGSAWSRVNDNDLAKLWAQGLSTREIGVMLGRSRNSIIGRANRLKLPARSSPIKRGEPKVKRRMAMPEDSVVRACPMCGRR